jgi:hypothetical protein
MVGLLLISTSFLSRCTYTDGSCLFSFRHFLAAVQRSPSCLPPLCFCSCDAAWAVFTITMWSARLFHADRSDDASDICNAGLNSELHLSDIKSMWMLTDAAPKLFKLSLHRARTIKSNQLVAEFAHFLELGLSMYSETVLYRRRCKVQ